jgi:ABC-type nitrate/sulfonate/bicarbonate transport system substrate-binding protein
MLPRLHLPMLLALLLIPIYPVSRGEAAVGVKPATIEVGVQPLGQPAGVIGALIGRDAILKRELARLGYSLKTVPFKRGNDMVDLMGTRIQAAILGDMPTIASAQKTGICIVGLSKQTFTSIVSRNVTLLAQLKGKRIGFSEGSSAHHTLLQALASVGLTEREVALVPLGIEAMPDALQAGNIAAFAGWEPAPSIALASNPQNRVLFKGLSSDYFVLSRDFASRHPEAALEIVAAFYRAIAWMRKSTANIELAADWVRKDAEGLSGTTSKLTNAQTIDIARKDVLDIPSAPAILRRPGEKPRLSDEFAFLKAQGKIPASADLPRLQAAFDYDGLQRVLKSPRRYHLNEYHYLP